MKIKIICINLIILSIIFSHCSNENNEILAIYDNGQLTKLELINRIGKDKYNNILDSNDSFNTIQQYAFKKIIFDKNTELFNDRSIDDEIARIANDHKLKLLLDHLLKNYSISDSIINYVSKAELTQYTIQDIVVTHRLSYSQNQDRSPKEAYDIAKIIRKRITNNQISFDDAVSIYGEHPSIKLRNGIMGPLPFGVLPKELNDIIWQSKPKMIIGPVGTKFGYHILQTIKKEDIAVPQEKDRNAKIKKKIKNGRYGYLDYYTDSFADTLFKKYGGNIYMDNIDTLWQIADSLDLFVLPDGIPIHSLQETNFEKPLAKLNNKNLSINWFIDQANRQGTYRKSNFVKAYFLHNMIRDILYRYCSIRWFDENKTIFNHHKTHNSIRKMQENHLLKQYINQEINKDSTLTDNIILNRLAIKYNLEIH